ncbi:MAG: DUF1343 domain-containing protein [Oscillospiraceae bacterium]|nr:DUF1343 domain-containing protein [Oscillospiraceae bacterium]
MKIENGIDQTEEIKKALSGARVGLVTAPAGVNRGLVHSADILPGLCDLRVLFSPEHGVRGDKAAGEKVEDMTDGRTGLTAYSIYGSGHRPTAEMLGLVDIVVIDLFDIGCRYYTFISTLRNVMEECARHEKKVVVLDRVNPINGVTVEGNLLDMRFSSFVGTAPIPQRHGMTIGELALLMQGEYDINCALDVIKTSGWDRGLYYDRCGLLWINPSPNIPTCETALLYPGTCLFEGTNLSEGRGTTKPFEWIGAPWLDAYRAADSLNNLQLPGIIFRPVYFTPTASKHAGVPCQGVQAHITDRDSFLPVETGIKMLFALKELSGGEFSWIENSGRYFIDLLAGTDRLRDPNLCVEGLLEDWRSDAEIFMRQRGKYIKV